MDTKTETEVQKLVGRVRKIFKERGYCFLQMPGSKDIFCHANTLEDGSFHDLKEGNWLEFQLLGDDSGRLRTKVAKLLSDETVAEMRERGEIEL